ncbi:MAG: acyl carrier protein [bacterium]
MAVDYDLLAKIKERKNLTNRVKETIIKELNLELTPREIDDDEPLFAMGLGLDSVDALQLVLAVEEEFGITISEEDIEAFRSVNSIADYIQQQWNKMNGDR